MNEKKLAANRRNALRSTGPKTPRGKAASSRNALKHGILAASPILPGLESRKAWEKHRDGILKSLLPVGYLEQLLTLRLAGDSWILFRVDPYEAEVAAAAVAAAETDLAERDEDGSGKPSDPATARAKAERAALIIGVLESLSKMDDGARLDAEVTVAALWALWEEVPKGTESPSVPGIPDDDAEFDAFDHWTAGLLRKAAEVYAAEAGMTAEALLNKCLASAYRKRDAAVEQERDLLERGKRWELLLGRESRSRMLLNPDTLAKVARYKSDLERSFFRTLHELQRLQASRSGAVVPPPAAVDIDMDLTVHKEGTT